MSRAEFHTQEGGIQNANSSATSLSIVRARSPHPPEQDHTILGQPNPNKEALDLSELRKEADVTPTDGDEEKASVEAQKETVKSSSVRLTAFLQFACACFTLFLAGWNDGTTGPLLPRMQTNYHVGYAVVSLIFIFNCVGFVGGALANVYLVDRLGLGKVQKSVCASAIAYDACKGSAAQVIGYALMAPAPPFPVFVLGFVFNGFGISLQDAGANGYVASLKDNAETKMGILHAIYGVGALVAPLSATQFAKAQHWSYQYIISIGIAVANTIVILVIFRGRRQEECLAEIGQARTETTTANHEENKYRQIFRLREVHFLAFFILIYVGVEVTIGGWTVTYIQQVRGGGANAGYVSTGFFAGLTVGRVGLLWLNKKIGERNAIFLYTVLALALVFVIWFVPSLVGGAIAVSFIGMFLGPIYPLVMNHTARILPHWLLTGSIGWIAGLGQAGSAFIPFITGAIASREGIAALQPVMVAMMGTMFVLWVVVPSSPRHID
ncbi:MFS general substrate transporter [Trametopsis cervina]|nr:MFS general substrate transporter [Trametopsis cervina]